MSRRNVLTSRSNNLKNIQSTNVGTAKSILNKGIGLTKSMGQLSMDKYVVQQEKRQAQKSSQSPRPKRLSLSQMDNNKENIKPSNDMYIPPPKVYLDFDPAPEVDVDKETENDFTAFSEFICDIMAYYKSREPIFQARNYLPDVRAAIYRMVAVDFFLEVQEAFDLTHETVYYSVNIFDRFFSKHEFVYSKKQMKLIASTCIFLASKFEERSPPYLDELCQTTQDSIKPSELVEMEKQVLQSIGFDLGAPLSYSYLRRYGRAIKANIKLLTTARYILEVSLYFLDFCRVSPSRIAAAALLWALKVTNSGEWSTVLYKYSGYSLQEIEFLMWHLNHMLHVLNRNEGNNKVKTVIKKYSDSAFFKAAKTPLLEDKLPSTDPIYVPKFLTLPQSFAGSKYHSN